MSQEIIADRQGNARLVEGMTPLVVWLVYPISLLKPEPDQPENSGM